MTERYSFTVDRHLVPNLSVDGSVVWNQDNMENVNTTLSDTINEGYVTAEEDSPTQYLSVLDTSNEISLENLNITLANPKLEIEETSEAFESSEHLIDHSVEENDQQVVVYTVEGSDELYGIQIAQDEEGNFQKYQFQFRKNEDGQLEAIPETVQLLPMDEITTEANNDENIEHQMGDDVEQTVDEAHSMHIFIQEDNSSEHILPDNSNEIQDEQDEEYEETTVLYEHEDAEEEAVDIKPGILNLHNVKQEMQEHQIEYDTTAAMEEESTEAFAESLEGQEVNYHPSNENLQEAIDDDNHFEYQNHIEENRDVESESHLIEYHNHEQGISEENSNISESIVNEVNSEYQEKIVDQNFIRDTANKNFEIGPENEQNMDSQEDTDEFNNENNMNDSDLDDYHIVEGLHITGDVDDDVNNSPVEPVIEKTASVNNTNILKHALKTNKDIKVKKDNKLYLYVVQHPEKENVDSFSLDMANMCKPIKANPRSILKSSHAMLQGKNENETALQYDERLGKRFARCKEAVQARIFLNFINKTTIPQAPVRKDRLPRKQKIKPVERMDEEIVVQEVMVSSNGFVEAVAADAFNKENLEVTEYVELTDSDDDYDPKKVNKKKKKHRKKRVEITISDDSDVSNESVIELDETDDENNQHKEQEVPKSPTNATENSDLTISPTKRRRGRPPKNLKPSPEEPQSTASDKTESPIKKVRLGSNEESEKPEIPCPKCDKTFPSQNSLKTHLQHHSLQNSLRNSLPEWKYKCDDCQSTFKNNILLTKHTCSKNFICPFCKKKFSKISDFNGHKRIHAKEQLIKSTTSAVPISPKKIKTAPSTNTFKSPKKINSLKCKTCSKLCSSLQNLNIHMKTHREYICGTCSTSFVSHLTLEKHVRENCVKSPQAVRRSMRIRNTSSESDSEKTVAGKSKSPVKWSKVNCDKCSEQFLTQKALFKHKVFNHGLETPDKSILEKDKSRSLHKERGVHGGVPATRKLKNVYANLRQQLDFMN